MVCYCDISRMLYIETNWHPQPALGPQSGKSRHWRKKHMSATPSASTAGSECLFLSGATRVPTFGDHEGSEIHVLSHRSMVFETRLLTEKTTSELKEILNVLWKP